MIAHGLLALGVLLGHACLATWVVNVVHGHGIPERWMRRIGPATIAAMIALSLAVAVLAMTRPLAAWPAPMRLYGVACLASALVALPASELSRAIRRRPEGLRGRGPTDLIEAGDLAPPAPGPGRWWLRIPGNESLRLRSTDWEFPIAGWPAALDGLSILHISDFHYSSAYDRSYFDRVADELAGLDADLALFTGDLVDDPECLPWIVPTLSRIRARLGRFAILGNHDFAQDYRSIYREIRRSGFSMLEGRWATIEAGGARLAVGGTSAPWGRSIRRAPMPEADARILLSHTPDRVYEAARLGVDLMLSGHNHGGQVRLPGIGPILMPSRHGRRHDRGFFREGPTLLHVSGGVGAKHPLRFRCPPEVSRLVVRSPSTLGRGRPVGEGAVGSASSRG